MLRPAAPASAAAALGPTRALVSVLCYATSARAATIDQINDAMEVVIEAERKLGAMLAKIVPQRGGRPKPSHDGRVCLKDLGITWSQSHRWQVMATIEEQRYKAWVAQERKAKRRLTQGAQGRRSGDAPASRRGDG